ncbi:hypothetical protein [Microbacterium sp. KR10-403]|uniref:hypothetical protein n=1 Tax=Microbacterium sp. KR10-403 TaxID=3158581 RepID=UPI0032E41018
MATAAPVHVGTVNIQCPVCDTIIPAEVTAVLVPAAATESGRIELACTPDLTDMWAHMWTHQ